MIALRAALLVALTLTAAVLLSSARPFARASDTMDRVFNAAPRWTQVTDLQRDPRTQEPSGGDRPRASFDKLAAHWAQYSRARRVIFIGNSQMMAVSLALGEEPPTAPEKTYVDLAAEQFQSSPNSPEALCYRLSAPGMSYTEALWYALYLSTRADLKPHALWLQLNYQSFWNGGVRDGMLELLSDPAFAARIRAEADSGRAYAETLQEALRAYASRRPSAPEKQSAGPDDWIRGKIAAWPGLRSRSANKSDFIDMMYRSRVYFLGLRPSTARSITGVRLARSQESIDAIAALCRKESIALVMFHAPMNPRVSLYRTAEDREAYYEFAGKVAARHGCRLLDWSNAIPAELWGSWMKGPDPLHLGRRGHRLMAGQVVAEIRRHGL